MANESTSFTRSSFAGAGSQQASGKPWLAANGNNIVGVDVNGERIVTPLRLLGREITYTSVELERSQLLGAGMAIPGQYQAIALTRGEFLQQARLTHARLAADEDGAARA